MFSPSFTKFQKWSVSHLLKQLLASVIIVELATDVHLNGANTGYKTGSDLFFLNNTDHLMLNWLQIRQ